MAALGSRSWSFLVELSELKHVGLVCASKMGVVAAAEGLDDVWPAVALVLGLPCRLGFYWALAMESILLVVFWAS
jgi:hypothetical protein